MKQRLTTVGTGVLGRCPLARRQFLASCAGCTAALGAACMTRLATAGQTSAQGGSGVKVQVVFTHVPPERPTWPNIGYDYEGRKQELLRRLKQACPDMEFSAATVMNAQQAQQLLEQTKDRVDGYLVYMIGLWTRAPQVIGASGKPTLFVDDLFGGSGEFLIAYAAARRQGWKVEGISTSNWQDVAAAVKCFQILKQPGKTVDDFLAACRQVRLRGTKPLAAELTCKPDEVKAASVKDALARLKESKILCVGRNPGRYGTTIEQVFGTKVIPVTFEELHDAHMKADRQKAEEFAERWISGAEKVIEPTREEIVNSGAMYVAMQQLMEKYGANAISINCLGGFYGGHLKAYPCLGYCQLNNDGLVGACEADLRSTITMLAMGALVGRPGYISDPVIDTSKYEIIYAHCVAMTKPFGPDGPSNPYHIRNHSEDRKGASIRSLLPLGYMTTTLEIEPGRKEIVLHQGVSVENIDEDKACRTKLAVQVVGDIEKLFNEWDRWGWHRVTFYGDLKEHVYALADAIGFKVIEEA